MQTAMMDRKLQHISDADPPKDHADVISSMESNIQSLLEALLELGVCASDVQPTALEAGSIEPNGVNGGNVALQGINAPGGLVGRKVEDTVQAMKALFGPPYQRDPALDGLLVPSEVIEYVDQGRNPELYSREILERVAGENMFTSGILDAISSYRDLLATEMKEAFPALIGPIDELGLPRPALSDHREDADIKMEEG